MSSSDLNPHNRPRVLQVITHLSLGGAERVAFSLMRGLGSQYDFALFAANGVDAGEVGQSMKRELDHMHVPLHVGTNLSMKRGGMLLAGWRLAGTIKQFRPDVIHLHTEIPESSYAAMVAMRPSLRRIPIVRTMHNTIYWTPRRWLGVWCDRKMARSYVASVSKGAQAAFEGLRAESGAGELPQPPVIIFNGVAIDASPRPMGKLPGRPMRILFAGRLEGQKGADLLPEIVRQVRPGNGRACELVIYGDGTNEIALRELAANPPAGWAIQVNGPVANLSDRMPDFDLLIMPSRYEGLALLAIEAAMLNLPVIATDGPGIREGFPAGYEWLAKAGDAGSFARLLQRAADSPEQLAAAVEQSREYARKYFDLKAMCDAYAKLYERARA